MRNTLNEGFNKLFEGVCKEDLDSDIAMYQKWVDDDIAKYGKISSRTRVALDKKGLNLQRDPEEGNFVVVKRNDDSVEVTKDFMPYGFQFPSKDDDKFEKAMHSLRGVLANAGRDKVLEIAYDFDTCAALDKDPSELSTPVLIETILTEFTSEMNAEEIFNTLTNYGIDASFRASYDAFPKPTPTRRGTSYEQSLTDILNRAGHEKVVKIASDYFEKDLFDHSTQELVDALVRSWKGELTGSDIVDQLAYYGVDTTGFVPQDSTVESCENPTKCSNGKKPIKESFYSTDEVLKLVSPKVKARLQRIIDTQKQKYGNDMEIEVSIRSPYKARLNYGEGGADYVKGDDGKWSHDYGYITINPALANAILSDVCSATGACDEAKKCEAVNDGKPTKIFKVSYIETLQYDENIEAKSERDAIAEFKRMQEEGEIDYSDGVLVDSKYEAKVADLVYEGKGEKK